MTSSSEADAEFRPPFDALNHVERLLGTSLRGRWKSAAVVVESPGQNEGLCFRLYGVRPGVRVAATPALEDACRELASQLGFTDPEWRLCFGAEHISSKRVLVSADLYGARFNAGFSRALAYSSRHARARARDRLGPGGIPEEAAVEILRRADSELGIPPKAPELVAAGVRRRLPAYLHSGIGVLEMTILGDPAQPDAEQAEFLRQLCERPLRSIASDLRVRVAGWWRSETPFIRCLGEDASRRESNSLATACRTGAAREAALCVQDTLLSRGDIGDVYFLVLRRDDGEFLWRATLDGEEALRFQDATAQARYRDWQRAGRIPIDGETGPTKPARRPSRRGKRVRPPEPVPPPVAGERRTRVAGWTTRRRTTAEVRAGKPRPRPERSALDIVDLGKLVRLELRVPGSEPPIVLYYNRRSLRAAIRAPWTRGSDVLRGPGGVRPAYHEFRKIGVSGTTGGTLRIVLWMTKPRRRIAADFDRDAVLGPLGTDR